MSSYWPEGMYMRLTESEMFEAYLPTVPDPLDVESPESETEAAERVGTYLYQAKGDPGTTHLQWHECSVQIYPWSIRQDVFDRLLDGLPEGFPYLEHELAAEVWFSDVAFSLDKKEEAS